jgi:hypothetical protein
MWIGHWLDVDSPLYAQHPEWRVYSNDGSVFNGGVPQIGIMSLNSGFKQYMLKQLIGVKQRTGLDGFFMDSYHNLVFSPINHRSPDKAPQVEALLDYQVQLQKAGVQFHIETQGIFGVSLNWFHLRRDKFRRKGGVEDFFGQEYTLKNMLPCIKSEWLRDGLVTDDFLYRATACGSPLRVEADLPYPRAVAFPDYAYTRRLGDVNKEYNQVCACMGKRRLLEADRGVEWTNRRNNTVVLFAYKPFDYPAQGKVHDVTAGHPIDTRNGSFRTKKYHTYLIG